MTVFVIAEAGVNHNGSLKLAKELVNAAVVAGANAVKFQSFKTESLVSKTAEQASYQTQNTGIKESQFDMLKRLELDANSHEILYAYCQEKNIEFMSTAFDDESIELLHNLGMKRWKIPSGELLSIPYLRKIAAYNAPTILSTGMGNLAEVELSIKTLLNAGLSKDNLTVLHANSAYPTPYKDVNLNAMLTLAKECKVKVGLSDHSLGIEVPIAAVALGAKVIEKHFTLDKTLPGPDHKASLEPKELKNMVSAIRHIEIAMGSGKKIATASEIDNKNLARKRIVAQKEITKGECFNEKNITLKRHVSGRFSQDWDNVIGKKSNHNYLLGDSIDD